MFILRTLMFCDEPFGDKVGSIVGFSFHEGVDDADVPRKLERLCRYINRSAVSKKRFVAYAN